MKAVGARVLLLNLPLPTQLTTHHLTRLAELVDSGKVKVNVDKVFPLDEAKEAFAYQEEVHSQGKVVLKIKG